MADNSTRAWGLGAAGLGVGVLLGLILAPTSPAPSPATRGLDANLWVQTSAEYAACCRQTYQLAWRRLQERLAERDKKTADPNRRPAVVLDLDETVFDNSPYQTYLLQNGLTFNQESWARWESEQPKAALSVPGAIEFLEKAQAAGVVPVYISNRLPTARASTIETLRALKLNTDDMDNRLLLMESAEATSKEPRRALARKRYDVLMYVGDNLRDLSEAFVAPKALDASDSAKLRDAIRDRREKVVKATDRFGADWFLLPNPVYGEWTKLIGNRPVEVLNPTPLRGK